MAIPQTALAKPLGTIEFTAEECEVECTYPDLVAIGQERRLNPDLVDVDAVEAPRVDDPVMAVNPTELGVPAADSDVIKKDCAVAMAAGGGVGMGQSEFGARSRAADDVEHSGSQFGVRSRAVVCGGVCRRLSWCAAHGDGAGVVAVIDEWWRACDWRAHSGCPLAGFTLQERKAASASFWRGMSRPDFWCVADAAGRPSNSSLCGAAARHISCAATSLYTYRLRAGGFQGRMSLHGNVQHNTGDNRSHPMFVPIAD